MAGNLHIRNLDDDLIAKLKIRAARHGRSAEAEHREILHQMLASEGGPDFDDLAAKLLRLTAPRMQTPSEVLLREGRGLLVRRTAHLWLSNGLQGLACCRPTTPNLTESEAEPNSVR